MNKNRWNIADVKARFSKVLQLSKKTPQIICNRDNPVGVVIPMELYRHLIKLKKEHDKPTLKTLLDEIRQIQREDYIAVKIPPRRNRPNPLEYPDHEMDV